MAKFTGFPAESVEFFEQLESHNEREWFRAHKETYDRACVAPMEALLADLAPKYGEGKVFRIYRDVRFSKDKTPYKTYMAATFPGGYISFSADGFSVATGAYMLDAEGLARFRAAVDADSTGGQLERIIATLRSKGYEASGHEVLKSVPRGYAKDHPRGELLRHKGMHTWRSFPPGRWLSTREPLERVKTVLADSKPLNAWLSRNVGSVAEMAER